MLKVKKLRYKLIAVVTTVMTLSLVAVTTITHTQWRSFANSR